MRSAYLHPVTSYESWHVTLWLGDAVATVSLPRERYTKEQVEAALDQFERGIPDGIAFWHIEWVRA